MDHSGDNVTLQAEVYTTDDGEKFVVLVMDDDNGVRHELYVKSQENAQAVTRALRDAFPGLVRRVAREPLNYGSELPPTLLS